MKTDEAPEKIYVHRSLHLGLLTASQINITGSDVEYTRTDAFIEKACLILKDISCPFEIIEQFKNRIK